MLRPAGEAGFLSKIKTKFPCLPAGRCVNSVHFILQQALRTYSVKEMNELVSDLKNNESHDWNIGQIKSGLGVLLYLIGTRNSF